MEETFQDLLDRLNFLSWLVESYGWGDIIGGKRRYPSVYLPVCLSVNLPTYLPAYKTCFVKVNRGKCVVQVKDKRVTPRSAVSLSVIWAVVLAEPHLDTVPYAGHTWQV